MTNVRTIHSTPMTQNIAPEIKKTLFFTTETPPELNKSWGDQLLPKSTGTMRILFQNINGVQSATNWNKWRDIVTEMTEQQVDILGLAETNINWNPIRTKKALKVLRTQFKHSLLLNATSDEISPSLHKPGGASLAIVGNIVGTISKKYIDDTGLGRWVYTVLNAKHHRKIVIITAYRLCHNSLPKGHETTYSQQYRILRRQNVKNPQPKQLFDHDLIELIKNWKQNQYEIILMIDANTNILDQKLQKIIRGGQLYDLMAARHGTNSPNTYIRGTHTIDFIFGTENVYNSVQYAGMLPFNAGIISDHRAL